MKFDDEVLDNETRAKYYQDFCKSKFVTETEEGKRLYCVGHLIELDVYALNEIDKTYNLLRHNYPLGLSAFENTHKNMVRLQIINHENEIKITRRIINKSIVKMSGKMLRKYSLRKP